MLTLQQSNVHLNLTASDKQSALALVAGKMVEANLTTPGYLNGLLAREQLSSTSLGNGIAIPHGTQESRDTILNTGLMVLQFPEGVDWGNGQTVYLAVGIAARSDEHLSLLSALSRILDNEALCHKLATTDKPEDICSAFTGKPVNASKEEKPVLSIDCIRCQYPADTLPYLQDITTAPLLARDYIDDSKAQELLEATPFFLSESIALVSVAGALHTGMSMVVPEKPVAHGQRSIQLMVAIAARNGDHLPSLRTLTQWAQDPAFIQQVAYCTRQDLYQAVSGGENWSSASETETRQYVIRNPHGLHARPSGLFVAAIKPFKAEIKVCNPASGPEFVDARSLIKLMGLNIACGNTIDVRATGADSLQALEALEKAINEGLGE